MNLCVCEPLYVWASTSLLSLNLWASMSLLSLTPRTSVVASVCTDLYEPAVSDSLCFRCCSRDDIGINPLWFMFYFGKFICGCLQWLLDMLTPAAFRVNDVIMGGYIASHVLLTLTELGVPDALGNGPLTIDELSKAVGARSLLLPSFPLWSPVMLFVVSCLLPSL